jgi:hypothetical protein
VSWQNLLDVLSETPRLLLLQQRCVVRRCADVLLLGVAATSVAVYCSMQV